jgi:hypothetical protein
MAGTIYEPEWRVQTECHGLGNWHAVIDNGRKFLRLPGHESQLAALAAGSEAIKQRTITEEMLCQEK